MIKYQLIVNINGSYQNYVFYSKFGINLNGSKSNSLDVFSDNLGRFSSHVDIDIPNSSPSRITVSTPSDKRVYVYYNTYKEGTVPESEKEKIAQKSKPSKTWRFHADTKRNVRHSQAYAWKQSDKPCRVDEPTGKNGRYESICRAKHI